MCPEFERFLDKIMPPTLRLGQRKKRFQDFLQHELKCHYERIYETKSEVEIMAEARKLFEDCEQRMFLLLTHQAAYERKFPAWYREAVSRKRSANAGMGWKGDKGKLRRRKQKPAEHDTQATERSGPTLVRLEAVDWENNGKTPVHPTE
jgi:hypothetical protein